MELSKRIGSMFLDHVIVCMTVGILGIIFIQIFEPILNSVGIDTTILMGLLVFLIYFNKDFLKGKSPAKRLVGLQVIDINTNLPASRLKCFIRNLTIPFWIIEVIVTLFSRQRRIGDFIAGTKVVDSEKESLKTILEELKTLPNNS